MKFHYHIYAGVYSIAQVLWKDKAVIPSLSRKNGLSAGTFAPAARGGLPAPPQYILPASILFPKSVL